MKKISVSILLTSFLFIRNANCQNVNWAETSNWKLYKIHEKRAFSYSIDTLINFKFALLNNDSMRIFLSNVSIIPYEKTPLWMGFYVASCQLNDGTIKKIEIGTYGGFFYDEKEKKYYQLPLEIRKEWLDYLADSGADL
jgi:hypothetical protein